MQVRLLYVDGCPNWTVTDERLRALAGELAFDIAYEKIETPQRAEAVQFRGSPTVLVDGRDPFAADDAPVGLSCRLYVTPDGLAGAPTLEQLREALA